MNGSILVSACLLGEPCRFDGQAKTQLELIKWIGDRKVLAVCPEVAGGLPVPRPAAEIKGTRVVRENGEDVTAEFEAGSELCVSEALAARSSLAILKSRSPACGCGEVYDGTFSKTLKSGDGIFTQALKVAGIKCISDEQLLGSPQLNLD